MTKTIKVALSMNVVVGKAYGHDTPVFGDSMAYVVFRPYWSVPYSIARAEFLPKIARDPDYLAKKGFEVVNSKQDVVTSGTVTTAKSSSNSAQASFSSAKRQGQRTHWDS